MPLSDLPKNTLFALSVVVLIVFAVYSPTLKNDFVNWDDDTHVTHNPFVHSLDLKHIRTIFTMTVSKIYIPLTSLSFAIEYHFFKDWPFIYHFDNVLLHLMVTAMVFVFSLQCGLSRRSATIAALIFGVHPIHVQSVAWVTERKDVLYSFFYMLALLCYFQYVRFIKNTPYDKDSDSKSCKITDKSKYLMKRGWFLYLAFISCCLSILAKPMALSLPLVLLLCDWYWKRKITFRSLLEKLIFCISIIPIVWITLQAHMQIFEVRSSRSFLIWIWSILFYLRKFFCPDYFIFFYRTPFPLSLTNPAYFTVLILFIVLCISLFYFRKNRLYVFAFLFYFISIFFLARFDRMLETVADRNMYLPSIGWCMLIGFSYERLLLKWSKTKLKKAIILLGALIIVFLSTQTISQCRIWKDGVTLWTHQLERQKDVAPALVYNKLAQAYMQRDYFQNMVSRCKRDPESKKIKITLPCSENDKAEIKKVIGFCRKTLQLEPRNTHAHYTYGLLNINLQSWNLAKYHLEKAVALHPNHFEAYYWLGELNRRIDNHAEAIKFFHKAIKIKPDNEVMYRLVFHSLEQSILGNQSRELYEQQKDNLIREYNIMFGKRAANSIKKL